MSIPDPRPPKDAPPEPLKATFAELIKAAQEKQKKESK